MPLGPVFHVELLRLARRRRYYALRSVYGLLLLSMIWSGAAPLLSRRVPTRVSDGTHSLQQLAAIGQEVFETFAYGQAVVILLLTPALVAGVVADDRQRKTLHDLLTSCLSSGEIVLGKLAARVTQLGVLLGVGLPILCMLTFIGGVDPKLVLLYFAGSASTTFFLSGAAVALSVHASRPGEAVTRMYLFELIWLFGPPVVPGVFRLNAWTRPVVAWLGSSNPLYALMGPSSPGAGGPASVYRSVAWMIGLQLVYGAAFAAFAVARLRPVHRGEGKPGGRLAALYRQGRRLWPRPACGDDPILWKERYISRKSPFVRTAWLAVFLAVAGVVAYKTYRVAAPVYHELVRVARGQEHPSTPGPLLRARSLLHDYLSVVVPLAAACWMVAAAVVASGGLTGEREGNTWFSLIATPLTPVAIIRAKIFGAFWAVRWVGLVWAGLLLTGLFLGAVHPIGFTAVIAVNAVYLWFACAIGTVCSLHSRSSSRSLAATVATLIVCNGLYLLLLIPVPGGNFFRFFGVTPFINATALLSYPEVDSILEGAPDSTRIYRADLLAAYLLSLIAYALSALILTSYLVTGFDDAIDRPRTVGGRPFIRRRQTSPPDGAEEEVQE